MKVVWKYADIPEPGAQSVMMVGAALTLRLCAGSLDLRPRVCS